MRGLLVGVVALVVVAGSAACPTLARCRAGQVDDCPAGYACDADGRCARGEPGPTGGSSSSGGSSSGNSAPSSSAVASSSAAPSSSAGPAFVLELVTRANGGVPGDGNSTHPRVATNTGTVFVAFESAAANLAPGARAGVRDVILAECGTGSCAGLVATRVSAGGNGPSTRPDVAPTGDVVFETTASNLGAPARTDAGLPVVVRWGYASQAHALASVSVDGGVPDGECREPRVSGAGTVVFDSKATNLGGGGNRQSNVFRAPVGAAITRVSVTLDGGFPNGACTGAVIGSGAVAFATTATNLGGNDRAPGTNSQVCATRDGGPPQYETDHDSPQPARAPALSAQGRWLAVESRQPLAGVPGGAAIYVRDGTGPWVAASIHADGGLLHAAEVASAPSVADTGVVVFATAAPLLPADTNGLSDVYAWSPDGGVRALTHGADSSQEAHISADGRFVVFSSAANLLDGGTFAATQVYLLRFR